jgi:glycosyltransferase involved in cell wall biosynthesis
VEKSGKMTAGLFTVIIPAYNRADLICKALNSVRAQTYRPIEIIVVDDGSLDNTKSVVETWATENSEGDALSLRYFYQENAGPGAARNRGIQEIRGEYVQFLDSDDLIHRERFKMLVDLFRSSSCEFIETGFEGFCSKCGEVYERHFGHTETDAIVLLLLGRLWANTLRSAFRRSLVVRIGHWNEDMSCFEDYEYMTRAIMLSKKNKAIHDILASARRGGGELVSDRLKTYEGRTFRIHCEGLLRDKINELDNISLEAKRSFASRIYMLGIRSNAAGWPDLGKRCFEIADSVGVKLDGRGKLNRLICRMGKCGGLANEYLYKLKNVILHKKVNEQHICKK